MKICETICNYLDELTGLLESFVNISLFLGSNNQLRESYGSSAAIAKDDIIKRFVLLKRKLDNMTNDENLINRWATIPDLDTTLNPIKQEFIKITDSISNIICNQLAGARKAKSPEATEIEEMVLATRQAALKIAMVWFNLIQIREKQKQTNPKLKSLSPLTFGNEEKAIPNKKDDYQIFSEEAFEKRGLENIEYDHKYGSDDKNAYKNLGYNVM